MSTTQKRWTETICSCCDGPAWGFIHKDGRIGNTHNDRRWQKIRCDACRNRCANQGANRCHVRPVATT